MLNLLLNNNDKEKLILIAVGIEGYQSARHNFIFHFSSIMYRSFVFNVCVGKGGGGRQNGGPPTATIDGLCGNMAITAQVV